MAMVVLDFDHICEHYFCVTATCSYVQVSQTGICWLLVIFAIPETYR